MTDLLDELLQWADANAEAATATTATANAATATANAATAPATAATAPIDHGSDHESDLEGDCESDPESDAGVLMLDAALRRLAMPSEVLVPAVAAPLVLTPGALAAVADDPEDAPDNQAEDATNVFAVRRCRLRRGMREGAMELESPGYTPHDGVAWGAAQHHLWESRLLTASDPRKDDPPGFKGRLFAPQATLLHAMCALERRPLLAINDPRCAARWATQAQSNIGIIKAAPSFGKTVLALALVCAQPVPARLPELCPIVTLPLHGSRAHTVNRAVVYAPPPGVVSFDAVGEGFLPEASVRYQRYLPVTIVAAATNVISQWESEARRFTDKRYFIIENVRSLREFDLMYRRGQVADYDLIFVKAGRVTTSFAVDGEPKFREQLKNRSLFEAIARILEGVIVGRLIIDDYDTLKLGSDDCFIPALFTWLISATRRQTTARAHLHANVPTVADFFRSNAKTTFPILGSALDDVLNRVFSLNCAPEYVNEHINSTKVNYRRIFVAGGKTAAILRDLEVPDEVLEMINADAVGTAAQTLGLEARSAADIIHRVVGSHLDKLRLAIRALTRTARARKTLGEKRGAEHSKENIKELRKALKEGSDGEADEAIGQVGGLNKEVREALDSLDAWATEQRDKHSTALNRMRDNIREGQCQCCMIPFEKGDSAEVAYVLAGCCQIIVCEPCITKKDARNHKTFIDRCTNCSTPIKLPTGLVRVGAEIDLETALKDDVIVGAGSALAGSKGGGGEGEGGDEGDGDGEGGRGPKVPAETLPLAERLDQLRDPKLKALIQFLMGEKEVDCLRNVSTAPYVKGILDGRRDSPWPATKPHKFLVFTMYGESTARLHNVLTQFGINHCILRGTRAQKDEAVRSLREDVNVMLVTAAKDCGGLNLPFLSHVVMYHRVLDHNVETQVTARGQRLGREHNYEIVTLLNEAEIEGIPAE